MTTPNDPVQVEPLTDLADLTDYQRGYIDGVAARQPTSPDLEVIIDTSPPASGTPDFKAGYRMAMSVIRAALRPSREEVAIPPWLDELLSPLGETPHE